MAAEFASSAAANAVGNVATEYASPYVRYFFRYGKIVEEFKKNRRQLELKTDRVKNDVNVAKRQPEIIEKDVEEWLKKAEEELKETQRLVTEIELKRCFDWCPSWGWRYCLSKKVAKKTWHINELLQGGDFQRVGIRPPLQGIEFFPSKDFQSSESSNLAFYGIMKALNTNGVNKIGLYGMPGVGKTTLAKEVGRQAKEQKLFDNVVMVTMSQTPNISNIQCRIAELLGLKFEASTEEGKAEELWRGLKGVEKILIIIDDVWKEFKLQTIGIPFGVEHEGCKILLTVRFEQICARMKCQEKFQLDVLSEDEAWALFKDNTGLKDATSTLNDVAKEVASACKGLPLAIVTIGKALNGASLDRWNAVNQRFKESRLVDNEEVCEDIYKCLLISYDYLQGDNIRSCFLLCSLFPEDFLISIELLIMFGIGHGLFSHIHSIEGFRREIGEVLAKLQDSGLLLKSNDDDNDHVVSMHDVVRDFSHWITSRGENMFMVKEGLTDWHISESFGCYTAISTWNSDINNFPDELEFSKLKILVFTGKKIVRIPSTLIKGMKNLRILYLKSVIFSLEVFQFVRNLRTLYFEACTLEDISSLKILKNLEILALLNTNIYELPEELEALHGLKSLHFSYLGTKRCNFLPGLLSRLTSLQELHVRCANNINLWELNSLSRLTALSLRVSTDAQCFKEHFVFPKLQRYMIAVNVSLRYMTGLKFRTLKIDGLSSSLRAFKELFCNVEMLALEGVMDCKNIVPDIDQEGLNELTDLRVMLCNDMGCLMDMTGEKGPINAFSNLTELNVKHMLCLKELCHGPPPISFLQKVRDVVIEDCERLKLVFQMDEIIGNEEFSETPLLSNLSRLYLRSLPELESIWKLQSTHQSHASLQSLKDVEIAYCNELKSIFSTWVAQSLLHLQQLYIQECRGLEEIFDFSQEMTELEVAPLSNLTYLKLVELLELKWIWKGPIDFLNLQSLKDVQIHNCNELKSIFSNGVAQSLLHLQELVIYDCERLEEIFDFPQEMTELEVPPLSNLTSLNLNGLLELKWIWKGPIHFLNLQNLKYVRIRNCNELESIFSNGVAQSLLHLQELIIYDCKRLEEIFDFPQEMAELEVAPLSNLTYLKLVELLELKWIWKGPIDFLNLQSLKDVQIHNCNELKSIFSNDVAQSLLHLQELVIYDCERLEEIFDFPQEMTELEVPPLSNLTSLELNGLPELKWIWKGPIHFLNLQNLKDVQIDDCNELKSIFSNGVAQSLLHLQQFRIYRCVILEEIFDFPQEMAELEVPSLSNLISLELNSLLELKWIWKGPIHFLNLQNLKDVRIDDCNELKSIFSTDIAQSLLHLQQLHILDCPRLEEIFDFSQEMVEYEVPPLSNLTSLELFGLLELKWIWKGPIHFLNLENLKDVQIGNCNELKSIFSNGVAQSLLHLQELIIYHCKRLEEIFDFPQEMAEVEVSPLSNLTFLFLFELLELNWIWKGPIHFLNLQNLKGVRIRRCNELESIFSNGVAQSLLHLQELVIYNCERLEEIFDFPQEMAELEVPPLSNLTSLELFGLLELKWIWKGPIHFLNLENLKDVQIGNCNELKSIFSNGVAQSLLHLQELVIYNCERLEEIFDFPQEMVELEVPPLSNLTSLELNGLPELKWIWKGLIHFLNLQNLKDVQIDDCNELKSIFSNGVAQSLLHLQQFRIYRCVILEEIFDFPQEMAELEVPPLSNLTSLELNGLPELKWIWKGPIHFLNLQNLKDVQIDDCNELKSIFSNDVAQSLLHLQELIISDCERLEEIFDFPQEMAELEAEVLHDIQENEAPLLSNLTHLKLKSLPELKWIWKGPSRYVSLQSLKVAKISRCNRLKYLFSPSLAQSLVLLEELKIEDCDGLEHITTELEIGDNIKSDSGQLLPKLTTLTIRDCPRLKYVFQIPLGQVLPQLKSVLISNSPQLKHVFNVARVNNGVDRDAIGFPCLQLLQLTQLTNLDCVCSENNPIVSPSSIRILVEDCPRFEFPVSEIKSTMKVN